MLRTEIDFNIVGTAQEISYMETRELLRRMWGRVRHCRHLAISTTDPYTAHALIEMANEGESDIKRLIAEEAVIPDCGNPCPIRETQAD